MKQLITIILIFQTLMLNAQIFEGKLTYKLEYRLDSVTLKKFNFSEKLSKTFYQPKRYNDKIIYHLKDSMYQRNGYQKETFQTIYHSKANSLYEFFKTQKGNQKRVRIIDTKIKFGTGETASGNVIPATINLVDSTKTINGIKCKLITVDLGKLGKEEYWFNSDTLRVNSQAFSNHNYEYLNRILNISGSFPIQMVKITDNFCKMTLTLEKVEEYIIPEDKFKIPELEEMKDKEASEFNKLRKGINVMDVK